MLEKIDPAEIIKEKYDLEGWKATFVDFAVAVIVAALIYFVIMPFILGANPAAVVVKTCSMKGSLNIGHIVVLRGASYESVNAPEVEAPLNFTYENKTLFFSNGKKVPVNEKGDVIVFVSQLSGRQLIHRVVAKVDSTEGEYFVTKGDANKYPDASKRVCEEVTVVGNRKECTKIGTKGACSYPEDQGEPGCLAAPVPANKIVGKKFFSIPLIGHITLIPRYVITLGQMGYYQNQFWC